MVNLIFKYDERYDKPTTSQAVLHAIDSLIDQGLVLGPIESAVVDIVFDDDEDQVMAVINDTSMVDELQSQDYIDSIDMDEIMESRIKTYSIRTISERLKIQDLPLLNQVRYLILDYRRYYKSKLKDLIENPQEFYNLRSQFINDMMAYYTTLSPRMVDGENIAKILGLNKIAAKTIAAGRKLAIVYKKIGKTNSVTKDMLLKGQMAFKEFIDALCDQVFRGWRSKIAGEEISEVDPDVTEIEDDTEVVIEDDIMGDIDESRQMSYNWNELYAVVLKNPDGTHEVVSVQDESDEDRLDSYVKDEGAKVIKKCKNTGEADKYIEDHKLVRAYSNVLNGDEPEGELIEYTPAEEELLHRESELAGDGKRIYSDPSLPKINWNPISKLDEDLRDYNAIVDSNKAASDGYTKYYIFRFDDTYSKVVSPLVSMGAAIYPMSHYYPATAKIEKVVLVLVNDEVAGKFSGDVTKVYSKLPKLDWGYTKDLISQNYDNPEGGLSLKAIKDIYESGLKRFYMFDDPNEANRYLNAIKQASNDLGEDYRFIKVNDTDLGRVYVLFSKGSIVKNFSNSLRRF